MKFLLQIVASFSIAFMLNSAAGAGVLQEHQGRWLGDLNIPNGPTLKVGADLFTRADGSYWASAASPDQGAYDIPVKSIKESGESAELDLSFANIRLTWDKDHFNGEWRQGGAPLTLTLKRVADFPRQDRAQTPKAPFPYHDETLSLPSTDGVTLGATLSIPHGKPHPEVVILVPGSGPATRDEEALGHRPFAVLADYLARQGVAVLRYDKRGISRSTGDYEQHTRTQLLDDLNAALLAMKARKQFHRVGLIGHSEGSEIAAAASALHPELVDFVVSLGGPGLPGLELVALQDRVSAQDRGANATELARLMAYVRKYYETIIGNADVAPRLAALKTLQAGLAPADRDLIEKYQMNQGTLSLDWAAKPFLRVLLTTNPLIDWRAVRCPVLALNGQLDHQVPPKENLTGIVAALSAGRNQKVEWSEMPSLNHLFQTAKTGAEDEYAGIDETFAPAALQRIAAFVAKQH